MPEIEIATVRLNGAALSTLVQRLGTRRATLARSYGLDSSTFSRVEAEVRRPGNRVIGALVLAGREVGMTFDDLFTVEFEPRRF